MGPGYNYHNLAFGFVDAEPLRHLRQSASPVLFVHLRYFPRYAAAPVLPEGGGKLFQCFHQPIGGFIKDHGSGFCSQAGQEGLPAFFLRQKTFKSEFIAGETAGNQGRNAGRCARKGLYFNAFFGTGTGQQKARIRNAGGAGVRDEGHIEPGENALLHQFHGLVLVELVMAFQGPMDIEMLQQDRAGAGVLGQNEVCSFEDFHCTERHILQVSHRRGHDIKDTCH